MRQTIQKFIESELLSGVTIDGDQELLVSGMLDSLGVMRLVSFIDNKLGIRVPPGDIKLRNFETLDAIVEYLDAKHSR